jgi:FtsZ-binding cell division protein ZapB
MPSPKDLLYDAINNIQEAPVQAKDGTIVYGNEAGLSLLNTCQDLQTDIEILKIRADASDRRVEEVQRELDQLTDTVDALRESSNVFHPRMRSKV